jgi:hypothetical protein
MFMKMTFRAADEVTEVLGNSFCYIGNIMRTPNLCSCKVLGDPAQALRNYKYYVHTTVRKQELWMCPGVYIFAIGADYAESAIQMPKYVGEGGSLKGRMSNYGIAPTLVDCDKHEMSLQAATPRVVPKRLPRPDYLDPTSWRSALIGQLVDAQYCVALLFHRVGCDIMPLQWNREMRMSASVMCERIMIENEILKEFAAQLRFDKSDDGSGWNLSMGSSCPP